MGCSTYKGAFEIVVGKVVARNLSLESSDQEWVCFKVSMTLVRGTTTSFGKVAGVSSFPHFAPQLFLLVVQVHILTMSWDVNVRKEKQEEGGLEFFNTLLPVSPLRNHLIPRFALSTT